MHSLTINCTPYSANEGHFNPKTKYLGYKQKSLGVSKINNIHNSKNKNFIAQAFKIGLINLAVIGTYHLSLIPCELAD